jgi:trimeric autotransporter adhesin
MNERTRKGLSVGSWASRILLASAFALASWTLGVGVTSAQTSVPSLLAFQGRLTDASNNPLSGSHSFVFEIYSAGAGGVQLWTETQGAVTVVNGVFSVQLGASTPLSASVFSGGAAYLQITADGVLLTPRERLVTTPYSYMAESLGGLGYAAVMTTGTVQVVTGTKTFTGAILVPEPSLSGHAASKNYVDSQIAGGGSGWIKNGLVVTLTSANDNVVIQSSTTILGALGVGASGLSGGTLVVRSTSTTSTHSVLALQDNAGAGVLKVQQNGSVGLGAANPAERLHVSSGNVYSEYGVMASTFAFVGGLTSDPANSQTGTLYYNTASGNLRLRTGAAWVDVATGTVTDAVLKSGDFMNGQLTIAGSSLSVRSNAASSPLVISTSPNAATASLYVGPTGNVGIGTTNPAHTLDITPPGANMPAINVNVGNNEFILKVNNAAGIQQYSNYAFDFNNGNSFMQLSAGTAGEGALFGRNQRDLLLATDGTAAGRGVVVRAAAGQTAPALRIQNSSNANLVYFPATGGIGVSTGAPQERLHVSSGSVYSEYGVLASTLAFAGGLTADPANNQEGTLYYNTASAKLRLRAGGAWVDVATGTIAGANKSVLKTGDFMTGQLTTTSTMTIQGSEFSVGGSTLVVTSGQLGIGLTNPTAKLHVAGNATIAGTLSAQNSISVTNLSVFGANTTLTADLSLAREGARTIKVATTVGDTGSNGGSLTVQGGAAGGGAGTGGDLILNGGAGNSGPGGKVSIGAANTTSISLGTGGGSVGVGTTNPTARLHVSSGGVYAEYGLAASTLAFVGGLTSDPANNQEGTLYYNTSTGKLRLRTSSAWQDVGTNASGFVDKAGDTMTGQLTLSGSSLTVAGQDSAGFSLKLSSGLDMAQGRVDVKFASVTVAVQTPLIRAMPGQASSLALAAGDSSLGAGAAGAISLNAGTGAAFTAGGNVSLAAGGGSNNATSGGSLSLTGGNGSNAGGGGGSISVAGGNNGAGGAVSIAGGTASGAGAAGGNIALNAGVGTRDGGSVILNAGNNGVGWTPGTIRFQFNNGDLGRWDSLMGLGIGTTSPLYKLDVNGGAVVRSSFTMAEMAAPPASALGYGAIYFDSGTKKFRVSENNGTYSDMITAGGAVSKSGDFMTGQLTIGGSSLTVRTNAGVAPLLVSTSPTPGVAGLYVDANNFVGMGTLSPQGNLTIRGCSGCNINGLLMLEDTFSNQNWGIGSMVSSGRLTFRHLNNSTNILTLQGDQGGRAGVNTASPSQALDVVGSVAMSGVIVSSGGGGNYMAGSLGLGNTAPAAKLDVVGDAQFGSGVAKSTFSAVPAANTYALQLSSGVVIATGPVVFGSSGYIKFADGSIQTAAATPGSFVSKTGDFMTGQLTTTSTMTIQGNAFSVGVTTVVVANGRLGVGAPDPWAKLHVSSGAMTVDGTGARVQINGPESTTADELLRLTKVNFGGTIFKQYYDASTAYGLQIIGTDGRAALVTDTSVSPTRVGIGGVLLPKTSLDVAGDAQFGSGVAKSTFSSVPSANTYALRLSSGVVIATGPVVLGQSGYIQFPDGTIQTSAFGASNVVSRAGDTMTGQLTTQSTITVQGNAFSVGGSTFVVSSGMIGLGTTAPTQKLFIQDGNIAFNTGAKFDSTTTVGGGQDDLTVTAPDYLVMKGGYATLLGGNSVIIGNPIAGASNLWVYHNQTFGTNNGGTLYFRSAENPGTSGANFRIDDPLSSYYFSTLKTLSGGMTLQPAAGQNILLDTSGSVGVSTGSPQQRLHVSSGSVFAEYGVMGATLAFVGGLTADPADNKEGTLYYNTSTDKLRLRTGSAWQDVTSGAGFVDKAGDFMTGQLTTQSTITVQGNAFSVGVSTLVVANGRLGLGITNPTEIFSISNNGTDATAFQTSANGSLTIYNTHGNGNIAINPASSLVLGSGGTDGITVGRADINIWTTQRGQFNSRPVTDAAQAFELRNAADQAYVSADSGLARLGIGTIAAQAKLHVSSANAVSTDAILQVSSGTGAGQDLLVVKGDGKVGLGTTNPASKLEIRDGGIVISGAPGGIGATTRYISGGGSANMLYMNAPTGGSHYFAIGELPKLYIQSSGNVGVGLTNPQERVHVTSGSAYAEYGVAATTMVFVGGLTADPADNKEGTLYYNTSTDKLRLRTGSAWIDVGASASGFVDKSGDSMTGQLTVNNSSLTVAGAAGIGAAGLTGGTLVVRSTSATTTHAVLRVQDDGGTEILRVQDNGRLVLGSVANDAKVNFGLTNSDGINLGDRSVDGIVYVGRMSGGGFGGNSGWMGFGEGTANTYNYLNFGTHGSATGGERMRIDENGNIGIGTTAPASKLHLSSGTFTIDGDNATPFSIMGSTLVVKNGRVGVGTTNPAAPFHLVAGTGYGALLDSPSGAQSIMFRQSGADAAAAILDANDFVLATSMNYGAARNVRISALDGSGRIQLMAGKVGVGTTAPAAQLHVSSANAVAADNVLLVSTGTAANQEVLVVKGDGKVGVGVTNPTYALQVEGAALPAVSLFQKNGTNRWNMSANSSQLLFSDVNNAFNALTLDGGGGGAFRMANSYNALVIHNPEGNIGLGTTLPTNRLHVASGTAYADYGVSAATFVFAGALTADPADNKEGTLYYNTSTDKLRLRTGSAWVDVGSSANGFVDKAGDFMTGQLTTTSTMTIQGNAFSVGGSTLVVTSGRVGINSVSPSYALQVASGNIYAEYGVIASTLSILAPAATAGGTMFMRATDNAGFTLRIAGDTSASGEHNGATEIAVGGSQALRIGEKATDGGAFTQTAIFTMGASGNGRMSVGINTQPDAQFAVRSNAGGTLPVVHISSQDGTSLMVVQPTGLMGIGTMNPASKLHLSSGTFTIDGNNSTPFSIQGSTLVVTSGRIGIGTTNPKGRLQLEESTGGKVLLTEPIDGVGKAWAGIKGARQGSSDYESYLAFFTSSGTVGSNSDASVERMRIDRVGQIGLGTTNPAYKVHAASGTLYGDYGVSGATLVFTGALTSDPADNKEGTLYYNTSTHKLRMRTNSAWVDIGASANGFVDKTGDFMTGQLTVGGSSLTVRSNAATSPLLVSTSPTASSAGLIVDGSNRVGVGTAFPNSNLHVVGAGTEASPSILEVSGPSGGTGADAMVKIGQSPGTGDLQLHVPGTDARTDNLTANDAYITASQRLNLTSLGNGGGTNRNTAISLGVSGAGNYEDVAIYTASRTAVGVERMRVTAAGTIGLGTTSPSARLHVSSAGAVAADTLVLVSTDTAGFPFSIKGDGKIGIGTSSPGQRIDFIGTASQEVRLMADSGGSPKIHFRDQGAGFDNYIYGNGSGQLQIDTELQSPAMIMTTSGRMGLGAAPSSTWKLEVSSGSAYSNYGVAATTFMFVGGLTADPANNVEGTMYYNVSTGKVRVRTGSQWEDVGAGSGGGWADAGSFVAPSNANDSVVIQSTLTVQGTSFSVAGTSFVVTGGRVGLGTTSPDPSTLLHIVDAASPASRNALLFTKPGIGTPALPSGYGYPADTIGVLSNYSSTSGGFYLSGQATGYNPVAIEGIHPLNATGGVGAVTVIGSRSDGANSTQALADHDIIFGVDNYYGGSAKKMVVTGAGQLALGTTAPLQMLEIIGNSAASGAGGAGTNNIQLTNIATTGDNRSALMLGADIGWGDLGIMRVPAAGEGSNEMWLRTSWTGTPNTSIPIVFYANDNFVAAMSTYSSMGVGTRYPAGRLHVSSANAVAADTVVLVSTGTNGNLFAIKGDGVGLRHRQPLDEMGLPRRFHRRAAPGLGGRRLA